LDVSLYTSVELDEMYQEAYKLKGRRPMFLPGYYKHSKALFTVNDALYSRDKSIYAQADTFNKVREASPILSNVPFDVF